MQLDNRKNRRAKQAIARRERRRQQKARLASPLLSAFLALSSSQTFADDASMPQSEVRFKYMYYTEHQSDGTERMTIKAPMAYVKQKVDDDLTLEGNFTYDGMSGASPHYLDSVSGASGLGIEDDRYEGQLRIAKKIDQSTIGGTFFMSDEDDYKALSGTLDYTRAFNGGNTQFTAGVSHSSDQVSCTLYPTLGGNKETTSVSVGIIQVLDPESILASTLSYSIASGYLDDPYKSYDNRPGERNEVVWMNRYIHYLSSLDGSIHTDLRLFSDDWGVNSQALELGYYQPFWESWLLKPSVRYYSQHHATFFKDVFPPADESYYSADQRLGTFGSLTYGFSLAKNFGEDWTLDFSANWMEQRTEWSLNGGSGSNYQAFHAFFSGVGLLKRF